jgi:glutamate formiminotransferase/formiminotetrahydrofolate cyclodeaminase
MDITLSVKQYLDELSSNSPTPGGGNVSAFCGTLASSLGVMVCNLTFGKKKYLDVEDELKSLKDKLEKAKSDFLNLSRKDNEAFDNVMEAFKLPKENDEQKSVRSGKIEEATVQAGLVPYYVISLCKEITPWLIIIAEKGNQNSLSDAGVALSLISTSAQGAFLNVLINCESYKNNPVAVETLSKAKSEYIKVKDLCAMGVELIEKKLGV